MTVSRKLKKKKIKKNEEEEEQSQMVKAICFPIFFSNFTLVHTSQNLKYLSKNNFYKGGPILIKIYP